MTKPAKAPSKAKRTSTKRKPTHPHAAARTVEQRVERIAYLMIKGRWSAGYIPRLARAWGVSSAMVSRYADRAGVRVEVAGGKLATVVSKAHLDLDAIMVEARAAGQFTAAVRAVEARLKLAGAYAEHRPGRGRRGAADAPIGLPPELAALSPAPSPEEVEHFASTRPEDCTAESCRVHGKAAPAPGAVH